MSDNMYKTADLVVTEGQTVELEITDMTDDGKGLGRLSGLAIFVAGAVPGDKVSTRITRLKKRYALAETITLLEASAVRVQPHAHTIRTVAAARCSSLVTMNSSASNAKI